MFSSRLASCIQALGLQTIFFCPFHSPAQRQPPVDMEAECHAYRPN